MPLVHPKYKVAVVQAAPVWLDLDAGIDKTIELINEAAGNGASLICFLEPGCLAIHGISGWARTRGR